MNFDSNTETPENRFWQSRAFMDAAWLCVLFGTVLIVSIHHEAFTYIANFSKTHERWELDEILTTLMIMPFALVIYAVRRLRETRRELTRRRAAEYAASQMALHDPLTGLPNRRKAELAVAAALDQAAEVPVTLMGIDLNRFKPVNDLHGHAAGDLLLLAVGERLVKAAGPNAMVCRFGGDEFCVLLQGYRPDEELLARVEAISMVFERPFQLKDVTVTVGASIGVTTTSDPSTTMDHLLAEADAAMYRCKADGRNGFGFFETGMEIAALRRAKIEAELRVALVEGRIEAHFQPLVRLSDNEILGFEALARWRLSDGSYRMPDEFIQIAEETGLISDVFFAVLRHAARAARNWPPGMRVATNLSPLQFNDTWLVEKILQVLTEEGVSPGRLEIEVTESALVADFDVARDILWSLKNQGVHVSLDDFGTGYSSLRHLSELPFETLKIDRSFISNLSNDPAARTIVRTVTSMAHSLGLRVTAEGIETKDNAVSVAEFGCDIGQGFLYGQPGMCMSEAVSQPSSAKAATEDTGSCRVSGPETAEPSAKRRLA